MSNDSLEATIQVFLNELKDEEEMTDKQRRILTASIKLFAEKGFHASSTAEIAKEAGVAEGTIFRHYKSKKDLLIATIAPFIVKMAAPFLLKDVRHILSDQQDRTFGEAMAQLFQNRLDLLGVNLKHARVLFQEAFFHGEIREALINTVARQARQLGQQFIEKRIEAGELRPLPPEAVTRAFVSMLVGLVLFKYVVAPEEYQERSEEEQIALTVDILLYGIANRPSGE